MCGFEIKPYPRSSLYYICLTWLACGVSGEGLIVVQLLWGVLAFGITQDFVSGLLAF